ncbi:undecaprenyl-phosphate glucose phosphotransferase [Chromobacterium violaceum]|nr:undecaprenyl-phosphate glucose phosphotransferase [Chromobacterium violaceum]OQS23927.1 undecaprenyl-phosphate glucose phosphotransferase [Chromobacterium violaceum]
MRVRTVDNLVVTHPEVLSYIALMLRLSHLAMVTLPGYALCWLRLPQLRAQAVYLLEACFYAGLLAMVVFQAADIYGQDLFSRFLRIRPLALAWSVAFLLLLLVRPLVPLLAQMPWQILLAWYAATLALLILQRLAMHWSGARLVSRGVGLQRAVVLGATASGKLLAEFLSENADPRSRLIGYVDDRHDRPHETMAALSCLGDLRALERMVRDGEVQQILVALPWAAVERMGEVIRTLRRLPVNVLLAPDMAGLHHAHHRLSMVAGLPMFNLSELPLKGWSPLLKRCEDLLLGMLILLLAAPVMLLLAVCIRLDSPGPVLFRQKRYGYNSRLIEVYKFRSMYADKADHDAAEQTTRHDPRVTRVGHFIRRTSLDELPQLFNVLQGSMSLVGPRPHASATKAAGVLFEDAVAEYTSRHRVKPGITGWAQVNGCRGETDTLRKIERRVEYDLEYIESWSLWLDLYILLLTIPAVISTEAAY